MRISVLGFRIVGCCRTRECAASSPCRSSPPLAGARPSERGALSVALLLLLALMVVLVTALTQVLASVQTSVGREQAAAQALCLAESGVQVALHRLGAGDAYEGESGTPLAGGRFSVEVRARSPLEIVATGECTYGGSIPLRRSIRVRGSFAGERFRIRDWEELPPGS